jgi:hypothetical protein
MEEVAFGCLPGFLKVLIAALMGVGLTVLCALCSVARDSSTSSSSDGRHERAGVTGYVLKVARESFGLTQEEFAECIEVDANSVQSGKPVGGP